MYLCPESLILWAFRAFSVFRGLGGLGRHHLVFHCSDHIALWRPIFAPHGLPQISFKESDGTMGTLKFEDQSLTYTFELHHGQSITFTDLPGGTSYDVDETNSYGHSQSFTGDVGAIPAGEAVTAEFVNHRSTVPTDPDDPTPEDPDDPDDPTPEDPDDPTPEDPEDPTPEDPEDPEDPENPEEPEQPEIKDNLWGVIGTFEGSDWKYDIYMTEFPAGSGIWISPVLEFVDTTQFKLRFNNDWNTQAGAVAAGDTLRTGIPTVAGFGNNVAQNVGVAKEQVGKRVVVYDAENNQLYLLGWSVIGAISGDSWGHDFPMIFDPEANTWSVSGLSVEGAFKLRWAGQWSTSEVTIPDRGLADGASFAVGTPISLKQGGGDINPGENVGTYNMVYDVANETLTLTAAE